MSIAIQKISYIHPDHSVLFEDINCVINKGEKIALVGLNGSGKSTLLRLIEGSLKASGGSIALASPPYRIPQHFGQYDHQTVAQALNVEDKLRALQGILSGDASEKNFTLLNDDWGIEERCEAALSQWGIPYIQLTQQMNSLSGGEKTKVFLSGLQIHQPEIVLLDEPTNHLDWNSREQLYEWVQNTNATVLVVSHDITLLRLLPITLELSKQGIEVYGGNYDFYKQQKEQQLQALEATLEEKEKALRLAKKIARETAERKQKHEARGKKLNVKKGVGKMAMNTFQDQAEKSTKKLMDKHENKMSSIAESIESLRNILPDERNMKVNINASSLHKGKILIKAEEVNYSYGKRTLWNNPLNFIIHSGDRFLIKGNNGSGKTTLLKIITGVLQPSTGRIEAADFSFLYVDQDYSIIRDDLTVYEQAQLYNERSFPEHDVKMILNRYLFTVDSWDKQCLQLSGGEKMRLLFCCLMISNQAPDLFILDEPTNNLDISSVEIITKVIRDYEGTLLVVSHDKYFLEEIGIEKEIDCSAL